MYFATKREHAIPLFVDANILPEDMLYCKSRSMLMHDINCKTATPNSLDLFTRVDSFHSYNTRSASAGKLDIKYSRLRQQSYSFSCIECMIWNGLPEYLRKKNKTSFKNCRGKI